MAPNQLPDLNRSPQEDEQLTHKVQEQEQEEKENQNENPQSEQQTVPAESESSPQDEEEQVVTQDEEEQVVKDTTCVSDDQTMTTTPCVPNPTPTTPPPTREPPPYPHCSSYPDKKYCGFETLFFGSDSDNTHFGSPAASSGFVTEPSCEPMEDVVSPQLAEKPTSSNRKAKAVEKKKKPLAGAAMRVWSEKDEIVILKGLMNFQPKKGCQDYWGELYESIKKSLSNHKFGKIQFKGKIYKLKNKYGNNVYKGERADDEHERECFELSKRIWGGGGGGGALSTRARKTVKHLVALPEENGKEVAWKELEKKWQIWRADEVALHLRLDELIEEQKKLMFD